MRLTMTTCYMVVAILFSGITFVLVNNCMATFSTHLHITKSIIIDDTMANQQAQTLEALLNEDLKLHCICQQSSDESRLNLRI